MGHIMQKYINVPPLSQNLMYKDYGKRLFFMIFYIQFQSPLGVLIFGHYQYLSSSAQLSQSNFSITFLFFGHSYVCPPQPEGESLFMLFINNISIELFSKSFNIIMQIPIRAFAFKFVGDGSTFISIYQILG